MSYVAILFMFNCLDMMNSRGILHQKERDRDLVVFWEGMTKIKLDKETVPDIQKK